MTNASAPWDDMLWVIWNGTLGILDTVAIGLVEGSGASRVAWLDEPYDMVGPFSLHELEHCGQIDFAACTVMSREFWQRNQEQLRRDGLRARAAAQARMQAEFERLFEQRQFHQHQTRRDTRAQPESHYRRLLALPESGNLTTHIIKGAYRKLAQKAHPDQGGDQETFIALTEARDLLLASIA